MRRRPRAYLGVLTEILRGTWGSANFFVGAITLAASGVLASCSKSVRDDFFRRHFLQMSDEQRKRVLADLEKIGELAELAEGGEDTEPVQ